MIVPRQQSVTYGFRYVCTILQEVGALHHIICIAIQTILMSTHIVRKSLVAPNPRYNGLLSFGPRPSLIYVETRIPKTSIYNVNSCLFRKKEKEENSKVLKVYTALLDRLSWCF